MRIARIVQAVALMLVVALAASCATSKEYVGKLFGPRPSTFKDSQLLVQFLELDSLNRNEDGWVETNITKDTSAVTKSEPIVAESIPASPSLKLQQSKAGKQVKTIPVREEIVAKTTNKTDGIRNRTKRE